MMESKGEQHILDLQSEILNLTAKLKGMSEHKSLISLAPLLKGLRDEAQNICTQADPSKRPAQFPNWAEP